MSSRYAISCRCCNAPDLLELVDQQQQVLVRRQTGLGDFDQPHRGGSQHVLETVDLNVGSPKRRPKAADRPIARTQARHPPSRARSRQPAALERRNQASEHKGRLSAARYANDAEEAMPWQTLEKLLHLRLPAEEETAFARSKRPQAGIRFL